MRRLTVLRVVLCTAIVLALALSASAQYGASIQGTVTDQSGAIIKGAKVTVTNKATGVSSTTTTSDSGLYRSTNLTPGLYKVTVEAPTFRTRISDNVTVLAERVNGLDLTLQPGAASEAVTVTAEQAGVETENATVSDTLNTREIANLPQLGRNPYELIRLVPGVFGDSSRSASGSANNLPQQVGPGGSNSQIFQTETQPQVTSNGQRVTANNITLDGVSVNSLDWGGAAVITPNQESVSEVTVLTNTFSAENGRNTGAQIEVVSKTGTNRWHGSGLIKFDDPGLNAYNKFYGPNTGTLTSITCFAGTPQEFTITAAQCPERVNQKYRQFGGSIGGPIIKDKLFAFFSYEGVRSNGSSIARNVKLPAPAFAQYVETVNPGSIAAQIFSTPGMDPRILNTISETDFGSLDGRPLGTWYQPGTGIGQAIGNGPDGIPDWGIYDLSIPNSSVANQFNGRLDFHHNNDQIFFGMYYTTRSDLNGGNRPIEDVTLKPNNWTTTLGWTRPISSVLVNELRANLTRWDFNQLSPSGSTNYGIPQIRLFDFDASGLGDAGRIIGVPQSGTTPSKLAQNTLALRDMATWVHGRHAMKFGVEYRHEQNNNDERGQARPDYQFRGLLNFANDACCFFEGIAVNPTTGGVPDGLRHFRTSNWGLFAQDDFKLRPNLTVDLGLRWEYFSPLTETNNKLTNYVFGPSGFIDGSVKPVSPLYNGDHNNFGPRLGVAWSPERMHDKLVVRAGAGIYYNRDFGVVFNNVRQNTPFFAFAGLCCFFDPGAINGPPPGSNIQYNIGTNNTAFSYPANTNLAFGVAPDGALCADATCSTIAKVDLFAANPDQPTPYVYSWSGEIQYEFLRNFVLTTGYYGSRSRKLIRTIDLNRLIPGDTFDHSHDELISASADGVACGPANPLCPADVVVGNNRFNRIFFPLPDVNASFDSWVTSLRHRFSHGLDLTANYTWSHSIDTASYEIGYQQTDPSNQQLMRASSDFDVRQNFVVSALWEVPLFAHRSDALGKLLGGWSISGILSKHTGFPWGPLIGSCDPNNDRNGDGYCPDMPFQYAGGIVSDPSKQQWINGVFPNPAASFPGTQFTPLPNTRGTGCACRNIFTGPGYSSLDMSLAKQFALPNMPFFGEGAKFDFRANFFNAFNILNLANFIPATAPTDILNTSQFGRATNGLAGRVVELQARFSF